MEFNTQIKKRTEAEKEEKMTLNKLFMMLTDDEFSELMHKIKANKNKEELEMVLTNYEFFELALREVDDIFDKCAKIESKGVTEVYATEACVTEVKDVTKMMDEVKEAKMQELDKSEKDKKQEEVARIFKNGLSVYVFFVFGVVFRQAATK